MLLYQEEIVPLLGTIFSGGLIHIYCCSEFVQWGFVCVYGDERTCHVLSTVYRYVHDVEHDSPGEEKKKR